MTDHPLDLRPHEVQAAHLHGVVLRQVPGFGGKYVAGSDGHIYCFSDARVNANKPRPFQVSETLGSKGYPFVATITNGKRKSQSVHRLICKAFHGIPPSPTHVVRHLDGDKTNNDPSNLRWGTKAENEADKRRHGCVARGETHGKAKLTDEAVRIIRASIPFGLWNTDDAAKVFGVDPSTILRIARKKDWKHVSDHSVTVHPTNIDMEG